MKDLATALLVPGCLLIGYGSLLCVSLLLRRKAQQEAADRPILQVQSWKTTCGFLCAGLLLGAVAWIAIIAYLFVHLVHSLDQICPALITQAQCQRAASDWQSACLWLIEVACAAMVIILWRMIAESKRMESHNHPERYQLALLTCSHCLLIFSWLMCTPLIYSHIVFSLFGRDYWVTASTMFAIIAILEYIFGSTVWAIACIKLFYAWWPGVRERTPAQEQWPGESDRDVPLYEFRP